MCGRYSITSPVEALRQLFLFEELPNLQPRYNVAPTQEVPAVRLSKPEDDGEEQPAGKRTLVMLRWGLIPFWAKDVKIGYKTINARAETVADKPAFREAFKKRRCLILADGFYEWRGTKDDKQAFRITLADGGPFAFAGLWESWRDKAAERRIESCTIIVTNANDTLSAIHERMPVILSPGDHAAWLDPAAEPETLKALLRPLPSETVTATPVSAHVNKVANDDPLCLEPAGPPLDPAVKAPPAAEDAESAQGSLF
ncbi:MAG: SOS response-associated peptidase [Kiloniellales bacterium]|nr:SOS response-associated peptidase [Kiloniellales bacterium]